MKEQLNEIARILSEGGEIRAIDPSKPVFLEDGTITKLDISMAHAGIVVKTE